MKQAKSLRTAPKPETPLPVAPATDATPAWEQIEAGRFRPLRIRGSYHGRELG